MTDLKRGLHPTKRFSLRNDSFSSWIRSCFSPKRLHVKLWLLNPHPPCSTLNSDSFRPSLINISPDLQRLPCDPKTCDWNRSNVVFAKIFFFFFWLRYRVQRHNDSVIWLFMFDWLYMTTIMTTDFVRLLLWLWLFRLDRTIQLRLTYVTNSTWRLLRQTLFDWFSYYFYDYDRLLAWLYLLPRPIIWQLWL